MAPRAYWKGHVRLSLVSFPVQLHTATKSGARVQFHQIHRPTGQRVRHQKVVPDVGPIENDEIVKGFQVAKDQYVTVEAEELEALRVESRHTIDLVQFTEASEIDPLYYDKPYFVVPDGPVAQEAYRVIREALKETRKVALGQVVLSGREQPVSIRVCGKGMLLETLRAADEVKRGSPFFAEIETGPVDEDQLAMARELIERKTAPFDPGRFVDHYEAALRELLAAKSGGRSPGIAAPAEPGGVVVDLMQALKRSLVEEQGGGGKKRTRGETAEVRKLPTGKRAPAGQDKAAAGKRPAAKAGAKPAKGGKSSAKPAPRRKSA